MLIYSKPLIKILIIKYKMQIKNNSASFIFYAASHESVSCLGERRREGEEEGWEKGEAKRYDMSVQQEEVN
jgi:hypothetical protein